ncbi:MAG: hypothetical protein Q9191_002987 [Dirinaria sp. TL-2023a]
MPTLQIIVGTYEKILHGVTATLSREHERDDHHRQSGRQPPSVEFADTFLLNAHNSAIRCLAISPLPASVNPSEHQKVILASGSSDERVNLFLISASPPELQRQPASTIPSTVSKNANENHRNRELGSLLHHSSSINALYFPNRSKLLSAADDNTLAVIRTRDWTVLSSIKAPIPKAHGRPSGDTAPPGGYPAGVNDFAVHPSMKLMVSVGKGEKCMRLWNLVTGKKAGVLNFEKTLLESVGERGWRSGEGRKVEWNRRGEEFVVAFERGAVVFGLDSKPKALIVPDPQTKIHQVRYAAFPKTQAAAIELLAMSTEDGRVLFYSTAEVVEGVEDQGLTAFAGVPVPTLQAIGQLGGAGQGQGSRMKDFEILILPYVQASVRSALLVSGSSDGWIRIWRLNTAILCEPQVRKGSSTINKSERSLPSKGAARGNGEVTPIIGDLVGSYDTGSRITCLKAFVMLDRVESPKGDEDTGDSFGEQFVDDTQHGHMSI